MKRVLLISVSLILFILFINENFFAQTFTLKIVAMSPGKLNLNTQNATSWPISSGLPVIGKGAKAYFKADTSGAGVVYSWSITKKPDSSNAVLDSVGTKMNSFTPDVTGDYTISVTVGSRTLSTNIHAGTYNGSPLNKNCAPCHVLNADYDKFSSWQGTPHATMYKRGISGELEVNDVGEGTYGTICAICHTTGWDPSADNGNFGFLAKQTGWDTTWYKPATLANGFVQIQEGDSSRWALLNTDYPSAAKVAVIGCESCHGPSKDHALTVDANKTAKSIEGGVCEQCHDVPPRYSTGTYWEASNHATLPNSGSATTRTSCYPCHRGAAFIKFTKNPANPGYNATEDNSPITISCATCHDPHVEANYGLRILTLSSLANGYVPPQGVGGMGLLCMNCHHARENGNTLIANQQKVFADRFYPHHSPQADMFLGSNGYEYGQDIEGIGTHQSLLNACVTCHMQPRTNSGFIEANHQMNMVDSTGNDIVTACQTCHGASIRKFEDVKAFYDYDGNGIIEGAVTEVENLMNELKAILPKDASGEVVTMAKDSMIVKNDPHYPEVLKAMYNYQFVKEDGSMGVHNAKYAVALIKASFSSLTGVETRNNDIPVTFDLKQNFPNPFNPSTQIQFSVPVTARVTMNIYDILGRLVNTLVNGELVAGNYNITWDGRNNYGSQCASGIYLYQLITNADNGQRSVITKKMVMTK
jgi:hypothetical protein